MKKREWEERGKRWISNSGSWVKWPCEETQGMWKETHVEKERKWLKVRGGQGSESQAVQEGGSFIWENSVAECLEALCWRPWAERHSECREPGLYLGSGMTVNPDLWLKQCQVGLRTQDSGLRLTWFASSLCCQESELSSAKGLFGWGVVPGSCGQHLPGRSPDALHKDAFNLANCTIWTMILVYCFSSQAIIAL